MVPDSMLVASLLFSVVLVCSRLPTPYMDEEFHIPQTARYLDNQFTQWDPKITTFPGMYVLTWLLCRVTPLLWLVNVVTACRVYNAIAAGGCLVLLRKLSPGTAEIAWLFPPLFATYSVYYTDATALLTVLAHLLVLKQGRTGLAAIVSDKAVACRVADRYEGKSHFETVVNIAQHWVAIVKQHAWHVGLLIAFCAFLAVNGGIVVGDRENHVPVMHTSQFLYLSLVVAMVLPASKAAAKLAALSLFEAASIILAGALLVLLEFGWFEHPFLLSDNRHYTFYLWKYVFRPYRLHLLPAYLVSLLYLGHYHNDAVKFAIWVLCAAATVVPAYLVEPRYFIQPVVMFLVAFPAEAVSRLRVSVLLAFNLALVGVFALKPYKDIHFMW